MVFFIKRTEVEKEGRFIVTHGNFQNVYDVN